ncbi:bifunctional diaminohydroxyphosphoribosylaminopyrimidine deaminase/5-amino-6-(5-phosphoribosylamino)uracil reductase RibD [Nocardioides salarius]|uniref:bifunctional diaminohydroxyphosphoribosylaminopyrimidine deaminase/5-amino-6-(5-phosphoribosylamino)uracil reductase RibD n=1 Tax=Nocardioides salarius TaxID=374513 RepID=UPI0030F59302
MAGTSDVERDAMRRALELAARPGAPLHPNPRVGCVLLRPDGSTLAEGHHRGAGTPHAEVDALARAGAEARGATAVVTLEPCDHTGRTGPCSQALVAAGVRRVVLAQRDPNPFATGGVETLRAAGIEVEAGLMAAEATALNRVWTFAVEHGRPFVTWKLAPPPAGPSAAAALPSTRIAGTASRRDTHRLRALADTMLVGTGTVAVDDPLLTVRDADDRPLPRQPLRVVMGRRDLDPAARVLAPVAGVDDAPTLHLRTRDPHEALAELAARERRHVFLEGGPTLAAAFLAAGLVDEVVAYVAPFLLGAGHSAVADLGITTIAGAWRPEVLDVAVLEPVVDGEQPDVRFTLAPPVPTPPARGDA